MSDPEIGASTHPVWIAREGNGKSVPVVFDSPHSGKEYPPDFRYAVSLDVLRSAEDMYVDDLFASAPSHGAALLCARFPRSYIDVNRGVRDIEPDLLRGDWPGELTPGGKSRNGKGLIRSQAKGIPLYGGKLEVDHVMGRIANYYDPYHAQLDAMIAARRSAFGAVWHINCHSWTPPVTGRNGGPIRHIDFCLGDRDGATCDPGFTEFVSDFLTAMGFVVRVNRPFRGMELVRRHGQPQIGQHSLQIEINRNLYMDKDHYGRLDQYEDFRERIHQLIAAISTYAEQRLPAGENRQSPAPAAEIEAGST